MKNILFLPILAVIASSAVTAQQVTDFRRPGDTIRVEVKFDGPDASKIKRVGISLNIPNGASPGDQKGFMASFQGDFVPESAPHTFVVEAKLPNNAATGDYLLYVNAQAEEGWTQYFAGQQFQFPPVHIRNDKSFVPPTITVTERR